MKTKLIACVLFASSLALAEGKARPLAEELSGPALASFEQAKDLLEHGDFVTAHAKYKQAYEASKNPRLLWNMAACSTKVKRYARALGEAERHLAEGQGKLSPEQEERAKAFVADMRALVAEVTFEVEPGGAALVVDREARGVVDASTTVALDVGAHDVQIEKTGYETVRTSVSVQEVGATRFAFSLKQLPVVPIARAAAAPPVSPAPAPLATAAAPSAPSGALRAVGWTSVVAGVAAVGGGAFMHLQARSAGSDFAAKCTGTVCDAAAEALYDDAASKAQLASALYVGGGALTVLGAVLLWANPSAEAAGPKALRVQVGAASVAVGGTF